MENIIENGEILFKNGVKKCYDIIRLTKTGVFIGYKETLDKNKEKIVDKGFIPKDQIQKILVNDDLTRLSEIDFEKINWR
jgi:hypothetical protein